MYFPSASGEYLSLEVAGFSYKLDTQYSDFWHKASSGVWEPNTYKVLNHFLDAQSTYCDIGAWIGPTVLHAAKLAQKVVCFEPDPTAYRFLRTNIDLNQLGNVTSYSFALSTTFGVARMASHRGKPGDSMTSLLFDNQSSGIDVLTVPWQQFIDASPDRVFDVMKIDVEGAEFDLLPSMLDYLKAHKPTLYLSTHAPLLDEAERESKMAGLAKLLAIYRHCLTEELEEVDFSVLTSQDSLTRFKSFVFTDKR
ncbi:MAG: FkbM family methyltransferase [Pseudomonadales bacterium]